MPKDRMTSLHTRKVKEFQVAWEYKNLIKVPQIPSLCPVHLPYIYFWIDTYYNIFKKEKVGEPRAY